jgi:DNA-binding HxlR family transcriptional regulator
MEVQVDPRVERVETAMALIGGRWRPAIMFALIMGGRQRFSELRRMMPGVSQRMLTRQLRELERAGLVERTAHPGKPIRVDYAATDLGRSLEPVYKQVCDWASVNLAQEHHT